MKISNIITNNIYRQSFKAGVTSLYSDYDGTFMPYSREQICGEDLAPSSPEVDIFNKMYFSLKQLFNTDKDKFNFIITTGRNRDSYSEISNKIKEHPYLNILHPTKLITRDGAGVYKLQDSEEFVYENIKQNFPKWDKKQIQTDVKEFLSKDQGIKCCSDFKAFMNNADNKNYTSCFISECDQDDAVEILFTNIENNSNKENEIKNYLESKNNKISSYTHKVNLNYENKSINAVEVVLRPYCNNNQPLSKVKQIREDIKNNIQTNSNDLVVVAGNEFNDVTMLNPLNYLDLVGVNLPENASYEALLREPSVIEGLKKLPLKIILVGNSSNLDFLRSMSKTLRDNGVDMIHLAPCAQEDYVKTLKESMYEYSKQNDEYKFGLGYKVYFELLE